MSVAEPGRETRALTPEQRACLAPDGSAPVLRATIPLAGIDPERLRGRLDALAARHDILRTAFRPAPGFRGLRQSAILPPTIPLTEGGDPAGALAPERGVTLAVALTPGTDGAARLDLAASALALDRGSLGRLLRELADAHGVAAAAEDPPTYAAYAAWRAEVAADDADGEGRAHWQAQRGAQAPLHLPCRRSESEAATARPIRLDRTAEPALAGALAQALARADLAASGAEAVLQAAWWLLVSRLAARSEIRVGWHHDCRRDYDIFAGTLGVFEKTLPLALSLVPEDSVASLSGRLARTLDAHRGFQEQCPPDEAGTVGFALGHADRPDGAVLPGPDRFELCLEPSLDADGRLESLVLHADARRYDEAALACLLGQYAAILARLTEHALTPFPAYPILGAAEEARLLAFGRPGAAALPEATLPALIAAHAKTAPDAPALTDRDATLSYAELEDRVARLGARLAARGVGPERIVALDMPRSPDLVVAILGVWRAGGAYLPLDPSWPRARRDRILALAEPVLTLTEADCDETGSARRAADPGDAARMAAVIFTSGSTGTPKGVVIEHAQVRAYTEAVIAALGLAENRRFALTSTVAADLGNTMLFAALRLGACLVVAREDEMADGPAFARFLRERAVDCAKLVPSHLAALLDTEAPTLPKHLVLGGEPSSAALVARIRAIAPETRIANHYGPTECCVGVIVHAVGTQEAVPPEGLPLTRVLAGSEAVILDEEGRLAPTGIAGILHVGGAQLCRGYLPSTAGEAAGDTLFVPNPFGPGRLYRTGDRARYRPEGGLAILGRADDQLKLNGHRVEPGEVEAALAGLDGVSQAAVRAWTREGGEARLAAYAVAPGRDADDLRARLAERLPAPMLPAAFVLLDAMPRLANGKIDRAALPEPAITAGGFTAPRTALETVLADAMADLLRRPPGTIGARDDFFEAGGHSLLVIKLTARIRKLLRIEIQPGLVFDHRSPAALALALGAQAAPDALEETARLRLELAAMSEAERTALAGDIR
ncbi:MAG: amino acid adenylation domain-containing protein [Methylorubrum populi]